MRGVFDALGDPTRRRILELLVGGERTVGAVVEALSDEMSISQPAVSQHLKVLREARLVRARPEGRRRYHALDGAGVGAAQAWLAHLADPVGSFAQPLDALATEVARGRRQRRAAQPDEAGQVGPEHDRQRAQHDRPA